MARNRELAVKRNEDIRVQYEKARKERKYTNDHIFQALSRQFYLSIRTIEDIVYK